MSYERKINKAPELCIEVNLGCDVVQQLCSEISHLKKKKKVSLTNKHLHLWDDNEPSETLADKMMTHYACSNHWVF